jgi:hypothetical protein
VRWRLLCMHRQHWEGRALLQQIEQLTAVWLTPGGLPPTHGMQAHVVIMAQLKSFGVDIYCIRVP